MQGIQINICMCQGSYFDIKKQEFWLILGKAIMLMCLHVIYNCNDQILNKIRIFCVHVNAVIDASGPGALKRMESISLRGLQLSLTLQGSHTFRHSFMITCIQITVQTSNLQVIKHFQKHHQMVFNTYGFSRSGKRDKY